MACATLPVAALARKWFSVSQADNACALNRATKLFMLRPQLCANDFNRCAVSSGSTVESILQTGSSRDLYLPPERP